MRRPDAAKWQKGPRPGEKVIRPATALDNGQRETAVERAEDLLGIGPDSIDLAWVHDQMTYYFATRDPDDTEFFPVGHPRERQPRYRWEKVGDGAEVGWLIGT